MSRSGLSLRWRMILIVAGIPLLLLTPIYINVANRYRDAQREVYWEKAALITSELAQIIEPIKPYIESMEDAPGFTSLLKRIAEDVEEFAFIALVDADGRVIEYTTPGFKGNVIPQLADLDETGAPVLRRMSPHGQVYLISRPVGELGEGGRAVYLVVGEYARLVDPRAELRVLMVVGVVAAVGLVLLMYFAMNFVLSPLERLAADAAIIGEGNLKHTITIDRQDEIGFLAQAFNGMAQRLQALVMDLEQRVEERTAALERRSVQLEAVSMVSKEAAQMRNVNTLLNTTVDAISEKFGFYHTGIFVLDDQKEWAILRAASSEGGQHMLSRGHRLPVGQMGIVGYAAAVGKPRIAVNVGDDAVWFNNPDLPTTRSEMALPLKVEDEVIGVLDVQSEDAEAFSDEDISTLQLMADQLAIALNNARSIEAMESMLAEVQELQTDYSRQGWARVAARMRSLAYEYDRVDVNPVPPLPVPLDLQEGRVSHKVIMDGGTPVVMEAISPGGGRVLGYLGLADPERVWSEDELSLVESVGEQIALALENARLFENTQLNQRQQFLISSVLQAASNPDLASQEVLAEISRILAQGLDMAVGIYTYPVPNVALVHPNAMLSADGLRLPFPQADFLLSREHHIFFRGLTRPELGPVAPLVGGIDGERWVEQELTPEDQQLLQPYDVHRIFYVPINSGGVQTGFIAMIQRMNAAPLDPDTRDLAQNLANQIAVVIDNLNLSEETRQRSAELSELYQISLALSELLEPADVLDTIVKRGVSFFAADSASFWQYDAGSDELVMSSSAGAIDRETGMRMPSDKGLSGEALAAQKALFVEDYEAWEGRVPALQESSFRSLLAVPLIGRFGTLGVLVIRSQRRAAFGEREAGVADLFAAQAAAALENARLNREAQRRAEEFSMLYQVGIDLLPILEIEQLLESAADWARRVFDAPRAVVFLRDPETDVYVQGRSVASADYAFDEEVAQPSADGLTETIVTTRESVLIRDNRQHPTESSRRLVELGLLSQMGTPLRVGQNVLGALFVNGAKVAQFDENDLNLLEFLANQISSAFQNALQFGQTEQALSVVERQARYQANVSQAATLLTAQGSEGALFDVLRLLGEASDVRSALYFAFHGEADAAYWHLQAWWTAPAFSQGVYEDARLQHLETETIPRLARRITERPFFSARVSQLPEPDRTFLRSLGFEVILILTVSGEADYPGFILLGRPESETLWQSDEIVALQTAAAALSNTLARERLFQQVQTTLDETEALYKGSAALNLARTYDAILDVVREYTVLGQASRDLSLLIFNRPWSPNQEPEYAQVVANRSEYTDRILGHRYAVDAFTSSKQVLQENAPTFISDVADAGVLDRRSRALMRALEASGLVVAPLIAGGQKIGYIQAAYAQSVHASDHERRQLESLTQQAAIAVQNIRQLQTIEASVRRERMIREITERIQQAPDVQGVLQNTVRELGRAFGTSRNRIQFRPPEGASGSAPPEVQPRSSDEEPSE